MLILCVVDVEVAYLIFLFKLYIIRIMLRLWITLPVQGSGWKVVSSFEGNFPNRIKQLPLDRHFDINNVKRVRILNSYVIWRMLVLMPFVSVLML